MQETQRDLTTRNEEIGLLDLLGATGAAQNQISPMETQLDGLSEAQLG